MLWSTLVDQTQGMPQRSHHTEDLTQDIYCDGEDFLEHMRVAFGGWWLLAELLKTDWG